MFTAPLLTALRRRSVGEQWHELAQGAAARLRSPLLASLRHPADAPAGRRLQEEPEQGQEAPEQGAHRAEDAPPPCKGKGGDGGDPRCALLQRFHRLRDTRVAVGTFLKRGHAHHTAAGDAAPSAASDGGSSGRRLTQDAAPAAALVEPLAAAVADAMQGGSGSSSVAATAGAAEQPPLWLLLGSDDEADAPLWPSLRGLAAGEQPAVLAVEVRGVGWRAGRRWGTHKLAPGAASHLACPA